jgi:hypothetical protein
MRCAQSSTMPPRSLFSIAAAVVFEKDINIEQLPFSLQKEVNNVKICCFIQDCRIAAFFGHIKCLEYCHHNNVCFKKCAVWSALSGQLECLQYIVEHSYDKHLYDLIVLASTNHPQCKKYMQNVKK